ncbi:MAG: LamG domain-containing protein [Candidatus Saccharibacteria bacterium]|nr:LamG domain-containing protein [Candidatus Saccharibacteria bacterium]
MGVVTVVLIAAQGIGGFSRRWCSKLWRWRRWRPRLDEGSTGGDGGSGIVIVRYQYRDNQDISISKAQKMLTGHWSLDGHARDATPYSNHGTISGATSASDRFERSSAALAFNGSTDYVHIPDHSNLRHASSDFSISLWLNTSEETNGGTELLSSFLSMTDGSGFKLTQRANGSIKTEIGDNSINTTQLLEQDTWSHWLFVGQDGDTLSVYKDGALSDTFSSNYNITYSDGLYVGSQMGTTAMWEGLADGFRVHSYAIDATGAAELYKTGGSHIKISDLQRGLIAHWALNGNVKDSTPHANDGSTGGDVSMTSDHHGRPNSAYSFSSSQDHLSVPAIPENIDEVTISVWAKFSYWTGTWTYLLFKGASTTLGSSAYWIGANTSGNYAAAVNGNYSQGGTSVPVDTDWHLLTLTYDGDEQRFYVAKKQKPLNAVMYPASDQMIIRIRIWVLAADSAAVAKDHSMGQSAMYVCTTAYYRQPRFKNF